MLPRMVLGLRTWRFVAFCITARVRGAPFFWFALSAILTLLVSLSLTFAPVRAVHLFLPALLFTFTLLDGYRCCYGR